MERANLLKEFPFTFSREATVEVTSYLMGVHGRGSMLFCSCAFLAELIDVFILVGSCQVCEKRETRCSFLAKRGVHQVGMWMFECSCGASVDSGLSRFLTLTSANVNCELGFLTLHYYLCLLTWMVMGCMLLRMIMALV